MSWRCWVDDFGKWPSVSEEWSSVLVQWSDDLGEWPGVSED